MPCVNAPLHKQFQNGVGQIPVYFVGISIPGKHRNQWDYAFLVTDVQINSLSLNHARLLEAHCGINQTKDLRKMISCQQYDLPVVVVAAVVVVCAHYPFVGEINITNLISMWKRDSYTF